MRPRTEYSCLHFGSTERGHHDDDYIIGLPEESLGLNLGLAGMVPKQTAIPYAELQGRGDLWTLAPGWAWAPVASQSGPQTTASWRPFYLRATYLIGSRLDITAGVFFKMGFAWIWSR
jgi:hypothetical protein